MTTQTLSRENLTHAWLVCLTGALFLLYEFIQMNVLSSINQDLMFTYQANATHLSFFSSAYFLANVIFLLPAGQLLDRFSVRNIIIVALSICIAGTVAFALSNHFGVAVLSRFFTGIGSAFCFLSSIRLASRWFPPQKMALMSGIIVTMAMLGGWIAQHPMAMLVSITHWRTALLIDAGFGVIILLAIIAVVKDYPPEGSREYKVEHQQLHKMGLWESMKKSYFKKQNWMGGIYTSMMNLPLFLLAFWGSIYLMQTRGLSASQASSITGMVFLGTMIGSPLAGWISDKMGRRKPAMLVGGVIALGLVTLLIYYPNLNYIHLTLLFGLIGLITSTQVISYPVVTESNPHAITAMAVSIISVCCIGSGFVFEPVFGWLMDWHSNAPLVNGVHLYSVMDYHRAMFLMPAAIVVALLAAMGLRETYCKDISTQETAPTKKSEDNTSAMAESV